MSDCQTSLGAAASKRCQELRGRLCGSGVTSPAAWRTRRTVEVDGARRPSRSRCQAIVSGPASRPAPVSSVRSSTMRSRTASGVRPGFVRGRRERGSTASSPPSQYRRRSRCRCPRLRPTSAAATVTDDWFVTTLRTATRCFDMGRTVTHVPTQVSPISCHLCPELRHPWGRHSFWSAAASRRHIPHCPGRSRTRLLRPHRASRRRLRSCVRSRRTC